MIKKIWQRFNKAKNKKANNDPIIITRDQHCVSRKGISPNALKVLNRLNSANYEAYLVGGGVRDLLLGLSPKDFDIATNATPEEIKQLFRNCRLIGRRFRLAHILFGREVIEVATFRADHEESCQTLAKSNEQGMLLRDNVYGDLQQDAFRRDFTINALYYSAKDFTILDYTGGLKDLKKQQLKLIGDPQARYREDPVRILRAIRLACKLNLAIEKNTAAPMEELAQMLQQISPARLWDESNKLLLAGYALKTWHRLIQDKVAEHLFSSTVKALEGDKSGNFATFIDAALKSTDRRIAQQQPVTPAFLFAVFLWQPMQNISQKLISQGVSSYDAGQQAATQVLNIQRQSISLPKRFSMVARDIWSLQFRLNNRRKRSVETLVAHPKFRAAYDFLCLRAGNDPQLKELSQWWTRYQEVSDPEKALMIKNANGQKNSKRKYYKKKSYNNPNTKSH